MAITKNFLMLIFMATALSGRAMYVPNPTIPATNTIRLIFMGRTGAGKSTLINAFYNYAKKVKWNDHPKLFPIPTEFQHCNVVEYQARNAENHVAGQLAAVTQEPSEYVSRGEKLELSLIDCPGSADTRGFKQDLANTCMISKFLRDIGGFNAICIILPVTLNRDTAETKYFIEHIKAIIPAQAANRVFIGVSFGTSENDNIRDFVRSVGLPVENIFYFDNYALSKDGYSADLGLALDEMNEHIGDPFGAEDGAPQLEKRRKIAQTKKVKQSWLSSNQEFNRMLRTAKELGIYSSNEMAQIAKVHLILSEKISEISLNIEALEACELEHTEAQRQFNLALQAYNFSLENKNSADIDFMSACRALNHFVEINVDIRNRSYSVLADGSSNCSRLAQIVNIRELDLYYKQKDKEHKHNKFMYLSNQLDSLKSKKNGQQQGIVSWYVTLGQISMASINRYLGEYYDLCIRKEEDDSKRAQLVREKKLYMEQVELYQQRTGQNNN